MKNAGVRIFEPDSFARKDTEGSTSLALLGPTRTPRAANMAGEAPALVFHYPAGAVNREHALARVLVLRRSTAQAFQTTRRPRSIRLNENKPRRLPGACSTTA
jgi:hypothetical protein